MLASQGLCGSQGEEIVWDGKGWHDVEADEATLTSSTYPSQLRSRAL